MVADVLLSETKIRLFMDLEADSNSIGLFERLQKLQRNSEFPLGISWRCPLSVVKKLIDM